MIAGLLRGSRESQRPSVKKIMLQVVLWPLGHLSGMPVCAQPEGSWSLPGVLLFPGS